MAFIVCGVGLLLLVLESPFVSSAATLKPIPPWHVVVLLWGFYGLILTNLGLVLFGRSHFVSGLWT
jgi:hypothetical protein